MRALARCLIAAAFAFAPPAWAQAWPAKPIRMIVNTAAGAGESDQEELSFPRCKGRMKPGAALGGAR